MVMFRRWAVVKTPKQKLMLMMITMTMVVLVMISKKEVGVGDVEEEGGCCEGP